MELNYLNVAACEFLPISLDAKRYKRLPAAFGSLAAQNYGSVPEYVMESFSQSECISNPNNNNKLPRGSGIPRSSCAETQDGPVRAPRSG